MSMADGWEQEAENWVRWARTPGHDAYWHYTYAVLRAHRAAAGTADAGDRLR